MTLHAFLNDPTRKERYVAIAEAAANEVVQFKGSHWDDVCGCGSAACSIIQSADLSLFEKELGIPVVWAYALDRIANGLSFEQAQLLPAQFLSAFKVGADTTKYWSLYTQWLIDDCNHGIKQFCKHDDVQVSNIIFLLQNLIRDENKMPGKNDAAWYKLYQRASGESKRWVKVGRAYVKRCAIDKDDAVAYAANSRAASYALRTIMAVCAFGNPCEQSMAINFAFAAAASKAKYLTALADYDLKIHKDAPSAFGISHAHAVRQYAADSFIRQRDKIFELIRAA